MTEAGEDDPDDDLRLNVRSYAETLAGIRTQAQKLDKDHDEQYSKEVADMRAAGTTRGGRPNFTHPSHYTNHT